MLDCVEDMYQNLVLCTDFFTLIFELGPDAGVLRDDEPEFGTAPDVISSRPRGRKRGTRKVKPLFALVIDPKAVPVLPVLLRFVCQNIRIGDGGLSQVVFGDYLHAVPVAPVEPQMSGSCCILCCRSCTQRVSKDVLLGSGRMLEVGVEMAPGAINRITYLVLNELGTARQTVWFSAVIEPVNGGDSVGEDVHAECLVVKHLTRLFTRFHVAGSVAEELAKGDVPVFLEGVPSGFGTLAFGDVHHLRIVVHHPGAGAGNLSFSHGNTQYTREVGLGGRRLVALFVNINALAPFGNQIAVTGNDDSKGTTSYELFQPGFGSCEFFRGKANFFRWSAFPFFPPVYVMGNVVKNFCPCVLFSHYSRGPTSIVWSGNGYNITSSNRRLLSPLTCTNTNPL